MDLNLTLLPTSEDELEAQIEAAFNSEPQKAQTRSRTGSDYRPPDDDTSEPEYFPPDDSFAEGCEYVIKAYINPVAEAFGVRPLDDREVEKLSGNIGDVAACYPNLGMGKLSPKKAAFGGLALTALGICAPRIIETLQGKNMRNVTPQVDPNNPPHDGEETPQEGDPIYG